MIYYNEFDLKKAAMLKQLMADGHIPRGDIDTRSITEVKADEIRGYTQCHFFAGIGLWALAIARSGWPPNRPVWTGSCPCQSYSAIGKQKGADDDRDLWPDWKNLAIECEAPTIFGEQSADAIAYGWLDRIYDDMEAANYAVAAAVLPACSVKAPHIRKRLYFVVNAIGAGLQRYAGDEIDGSWSIQDRPATEADLCTGLMGHPSRSREGKSNPQNNAFSNSGEAWILSGDASHFDNVEFIECWDGKHRPVKRGIPLLDNGDIHAAGDAIVWQVAQAFIEATM